ncbi:hypothetical protein I4U23_004609 [Adineta vaga]|nr:hypothetical protein I4U23_004609 [Adineta vaga]
MQNSCDSASKISMISVTDIAQHETSLVNELSQTINDLTKQVQLASHKIERSRNEALEKANEVRRQKIHDIKTHFISQCKSIEERYDQLMRLEEGVRKRLTIEVCQTCIKANSEHSDKAIAIQQMINSHSQDVWQLRWNTPSQILKTSTAQASTDDVENHAGFSALFQNAAANTLETKDKWIGGWAEQAALARKTQNVNNTQQSSAKKPQMIRPCEKLIKLFSSNAAQEDVQDYLKVTITIALYLRHK